MARFTMSLLEATKNKRIFKDTTDFLRYPDIVANYKVQYGFLLLFLCPDAESRDAITF